VRMHPLALAESGWVWVGAGSRPAGLRTGRAIPGLRRDAALPVRQNTRQGREGGALPKALVARVLRSLSLSLWVLVSRIQNAVCITGKDQRLMYATASYLSSL